MSVYTYGWLAPSGEYGEQMGIGEALLFVKYALEDGYECRMIRFVDGDMDTEWTARR